jgi:hypothetical protein
MWAEPILKARAARLKPITPSSIVSIYQAHELRCRIPVIILSPISMLVPTEGFEYIEQTHGWSEGPLSNIPSLPKDQQVCQGHTSCLGFGSQDGKDGRVDMIFRYRTCVDELGKIVLVGDVTCDKKLRTKFGTKTANKFRGG